MKNAEMKLVRLDNTDILTTSGPLSESLKLANFGNGITRDATVTGYFKGQTINFVNSDGGFASYLENLYGDDFEAVSPFFSETPFWFDTDKSVASLNSAILSELFNDSDSSRTLYDGTYTYDSSQNIFIKQ